MPVAGKWLLVTMTWWPLHPGPFPAGTARAQSLPAALAPYPHAQDNPWAGQITTMLLDPAVANAHWGIAVTQLDGTPVFGLDEAKFFRPASTAKLFTTVAAMSLLGANSRVVTRLTYTGALNSDGTLNGYLSVRGAGDANFAGATPRTRGTDPLAVLDSFASEAAAKGIHRVTQGVMVDSWLWDPYPEGWAIEDELPGYGASASGLILNDNAVQLTVEPAAHAGEPARVSLSPQITGERLLASVATVRKGTPANVTLRRNLSDPRLLEVDGAASVGGALHLDVAVADPIAFVQNAFIDRLRAHGVHVEARSLARAYTADTRSLAVIRRDPLVLPPAPPSTDPPAPPVSSAREEVLCNDSCLPLAAHTSAPLADDVTLTLKTSNNLHAELMLRRLGKTFGADDTFAQGERVLHQFLINANLDVREVILYDGSGLSTKDLVTPRAEAQLLAYAASQPWFPQWKAAMPVGGVDGTLASRFTEAPLKGRVFAKTGTLGESRVLAGYVQCASGRELIFSILVDNHEPGNTADRQTMDKILATIAASN